MACLNVFLIKPKQCFMHLTYCVQGSLHETELEIDLSNTQPVAPLSDTSEDRELSVLMAAKNELLALRLSTQQANAAEKAATDQMAAMQSELDMLRPEVSVRPEELATAPKKKKVRNSAVSFCSS